MENQEIILDVKGLKQYFKIGTGKYKMVNKAVDGISFQIRKGEVFSLVGESGCGKTTTGRILIKLYEATAGNVNFLGKRIIADVKEEKKKYKVQVEQFVKEYEVELHTLSAELGDELVTLEEYKKRKSELLKILKDKKDKAYEPVRLAIKDKKGLYDDIDVKEVRNNKELIPEYKEKVQEYKEKFSIIEENKVKHQALIKDLEAKLLSDPENSSIIANLKDEKEILNQIDLEAKITLKSRSLDLNLIYKNFLNRNKLIMRKMQMIFQDPIASLNPRMTVKEIIAEGLRINGMKNEKLIEEKVFDALRTVGLVPEHASRYPHEFSGGQRQRIGIARSLVVDPEFIIADEPISALDVSIRAQVINLLNDLRETRGITIMFIAHDLSVVKYFSDRLAVMYYGKIVEIGGKEQIFDHPLHPYTLSLMSSIPLPDPDYEKRRKKLKRYNPALEHDYSKEIPTLREVEPDHFILCNTEELNNYKEQLKKSLNEKDN